jgi:HD-GYP domain-containing protein (c-di-GMP phosphodiesterase class II)
VARAAELHDVGKIAVPDAIIDKPGPLDPVEWSFVRRHPLIGERILLAAPALRPVARLVRSSHERWDGAGYPDGLCGDEIPLGARVVSVCDAFEAMTTDRPYREAISEDEALDELRRCGGSQFDPMVVEAFCRVIARERPDRDELPNRV